MRTGTDQGRAGIKKITLTLPQTVNQTLDELIKEIRVSKVEAIRQAIHIWIETKIMEQMAEGYREMASEDAKIMKEFEYVDEELW